MRKAVLLIALFCAAFSCNRYPDPSLTSVKDYSFAFQTTQGGKFLAGDWVSDSVIFRAVNNKAKLKDSVKVLFDLVEGDGSLTVQSDYTDKNGLTSTGWKLGYGSCEQKLRASSFDLSGNFLTSTDLTEYGFRTDEWDAYNGSPDGNMSGMVADTVNKVTFMISDGTLYKPGDKYYLWKPVVDPVVNSPRTINIDKKGVIYISSSGGDLIRSTNNGVSWKNCTKPYPDRPYYIYVNVSNDNSIWVFAWDHKTRHSIDGGITWKDIDSTVIHGYGNVFRLKDGSLLFHGSDCCSLYSSFDEGLNWTKIETPGYSIKLFVNDKDEILIVTQENGITIYKSTDYCETFIREISVSPQWGTSDNDNIFNKWGNYYYILIPGWGILKSADLTHYEEYWYNSNLKDLFIDQNGVMIGKDWHASTVYYRNNSKK